MEFWNDFILERLQTPSEVTYMGATLEHFAAASNAREECLLCHVLKHAAAASPVESSSVLGASFLH